MTTDRKKAILYLSITLIIGILIGSLVPGLWGRFRHRNIRAMKEDMAKRQMGTKQEWFTHMILRIVKPDSDQLQLMKPLTEEAAGKIGELEKNSNGKMAAIMDSLKLKLQPILRPDQLDRLNNFAGKANNRWRNRRGGGEPRDKKGKDS